MSEKQVLFLTRKFPPSKGGMETFSYEITSHYPGKSRVLHHGHKQHDIVWAAPLLFARAFFSRKKTDVYHLGDLVLAPLAPLLKWFTRKPVVATAHALELTHPNPLLRFLVTWSLPRITHIVAVSEYTKGLLKDAGVPEEKISVITHGVNPKEQMSKQEAKEWAFKVLELPQSDSPVLLTVGRLVERKGVHWFIANVLPALKEYNPTYIVTSTGPDEERIKNYIEENEIENVVLAGKVSDQFLETLYAAADLFVMPNINVPGDAEGFGFVAIEAAASGLPVAASDIEGVPSAIHDGKNGVLHTPGDSETYAKTITNWLKNEEMRRAFGKEARNYTEKHFTWTVVAGQYKTLFESLTK